jgi:hypothetical protein
MSTEAAAARRLYVYYRVADSALAASVHAVGMMQAGLTAAYPGLRAELLRRPGRDNGEVTLMEVYAGSMTPALLAAIEQAAAALPQPRHNELFEVLTGAGLPPAAL